MGGTTYQVVVFLGNETKHMLYLYLSKSFFVIYLFIYLFISILINAFA